MDASQADSKVESKSFLGKAASEVADFGEGVYLGSIESRIDGAVQFTNHVAGTNLPELHLVDADRLSKSVGGQLGTMAGTALDIYAATVATGGIADAVIGAGMVSSALSAGAVGAVLGGVLQPSDANSDHFFTDRLKTGAVGAATFAAMGGAASALNGTGAFAASSVRSLAGNLVYGATVGATGGVAHAEANALINQGQVLPNTGDLATDVGSYAAFGLTFGAANYAFNSLAAPAPRTFTSDGKSLTVQSDSQGNPVKVLGDTPALGNDLIKVGYEGTKMADGSWNTTAWMKIPDSDSRVFDDVNPPAIDNVKIDGNQATITGGEVIRQFNDGGTYQRTDIGAAREQAETDDYNMAHNKIQDIGGVTAKSYYDPQMRLNRWSTESPSAPGDTQISAHINYDQSGAVHSFFYDKPGQPNFNMFNEGNGNWSVSDWQTSHPWSGDVKVIPAAGPGQTEQIQFTPTGGSPTVFDLTKGDRPTI
jgi:hypothetical protein